MTKELLLNQSESIYSVITSICFTQAEGKCHYLLSFDSSNWPSQDYFISYFL